MQRFPVLRRRELLLMTAAFAGVRSAAASQPFWNTKEPAEWSESEIDTLITSSPWAHRFSLSIAGATDDYGPPISQVPSNTGGGGWGIPGTIGLPRTRTSSPGPYPRTSRMQVDGIVRWESALPIREALRSRVPEQFKDSLVISLSGIPVNMDSAGRRTFDLETIRQSARIEYEGAARTPELVQNGPLSSGMTRSVLLGFSRNKVALSGSSGSIVFSGRLAGTPFKVKFKPADMMYRGKFAV